jgi:hypothetical protein
MNKFYIISIGLMLFFSGCRQKPSDSPDSKESMEAKRLLQGIWIDNESNAVIFKVKGDTIYYPDSTSMPACFRVVGDTLLIGTTPTKYHIVKQAAHLFWFESPNGDVVKLTKSDEPTDTAAFSQRQESQTHIINKVVKRDTIVFLDGQRYHCYIAINPTKYKITKSELSADGMEVENTYYDNLIHVSIFKDSNRVYSKNFVKQMFAQKVPGRFLTQAILSDMVFDKADNRGFHFNATLCIPDVVSCYMVAMIISKNGNTTMELLEY